MAAIKSSLQSLRRKLNDWRYVRGHGIFKKAPQCLNPRALYPDSSCSSRFEACYILWKHEIPVVVWLEDILALYDSNKVYEGDLTLLVPHPRMAAELLQQSNYEMSSPSIKFQDEPEFAEHGVRLMPPLGETGVVLLPAADWYYDLDQDVPEFLPHLSAFLDSMFEFWLNISPEDYVKRICFALYIGQIIYQCYKLKSSDRYLVRDPAFVEQLMPHHREIHYDIACNDPKAESFTVTKRHEYHVRRSKEIRDGLFVPQPYKKGAYRPDLSTLPESV